MIECVCECVNVRRRKCDRGTENLSAGEKRVRLGCRVVSGIPIWHTFSASCAIVHVHSAENNLYIVVFQGLAHSLIITLVQAIQHHKMRQGSIMCGDFISSGPLSQTRSQCLAHSQLSDCHSQPHDVNSEKMIFLSGNNPEKMLSFGGTIIFF